MELMVPCKNSEELNKIRKYLAQDYLETDVEFNSYNLIGTDSQMISMDIDEDIKEKEKENIIKIFDKIKHYHKFLYHGSNVPIKQLISLNSCYNKIINIGNVYYYDPEYFEEELIEFAKIFLFSFVDNTYTRLRINFNEAKHVLRIDHIGVISGKIHNINGRIYLEKDGDKHLMNYKELSNFIKEDMKLSDLEPHYKITNNIDKVNVLRMMEGKSPFSSFHNINVSNYHKFRLFIAFAKLCKDRNLPMFNCGDLINFIHNDYGFEYYTRKIVSLIDEEYEELSIENFKDQEFESIEKALTFTIYLSGFKIKHALFENKIADSYTVCYNYSDLLDPYQNVDLMKERFVQYFIKMTGRNRDNDGKKFKHMSLLQLFSSFIVRQHVIVDTSNINHINPLDDKPLPLEFYNIKEKQKFSIYNIGNVIKGIFKKPPCYNRTELSVKEITLEIDNEQIKIDGVVVIQNVIFLDKPRMLKYVKKLWKKGYFLTTYGLIYYLETGEISKRSIRAPEWFTFRNSNEENLIRFLKFNDLV